MNAAFVEAADRAHQVGGVAERILGAVVIRLVTGRIAGERQCVAHSGRGISRQNLVDLLFGVAHTGQVRHRLERGRLPDAQDKAMRQFPRRSTRAVSHRDEGRLQLLQLRDRLEKRIGLLRALRREELEGKSGLVLGEDVANMHAGAFLTGYQPGRRESALVSGPRIHANERGFGFAFVRGPNTCVWSDAETLRN